MTLSFLGQRIARVLTRPPELLYAFTRHWFLILMCLLLATGVAWVVVASQSPVFQGRSQLLVTRNDPVSATLTETEQRDSGSS